MGTLLFCVSASGQTSNRASILVDSKTTILVDNTQPVPVQRAAQDLASDMRKVFGTLPRIVTRVEDAGPVTIVVD